MASKNQPSRSNTGHGGNRCHRGGGTSFHSPKSGEKSSGTTKSGRTGNTQGGGAKRSKP